MEAEDVETGFNAANETMVNMITAGIIDPTKVIDSAAVSLSRFSRVCLLLCQKCLLVGVPSKECIFNLFNEYFLNQLLLLVAFHVFSTTSKIKIYSILFIFIDTMLV